MQYFPEKDRSYLQPLKSEFIDLLKYSTAGQAMQKLVSEYKLDTVLDLGCGPGWHSTHLSRYAKQVVALDYRKNPALDDREFGTNVSFVFTDVMQYQPEYDFDAVWCSHVLEHQLNPNLFLLKLHSLLREGGVLAITVPPLKHQIVGGHVSLWNAGLLLYHLVLAGFDCREAAVLRYAYNVSIVVKKRSIKNLPEIGFCNGDLEALQDYLPPGAGVQGFNGDIAIHNWYNGSQ